MKIFLLWYPAIKIFSFITDAVVKKFASGID
jgi:hypothetical protein